MIALIYSISILLIGCGIIYYLIRQRKNKKINDLRYINLFTISNNIHMKIKDKILKKALKDMYKYSKKGDFIFCFDINKYFPKDNLLALDEKEKIVDYVIDELKERNFVIEREALFLINVRWDSSAHNAM